MKYKYSAQTLIIAFFTAVLGRLMLGCASTIAPQLIVGSLLKNFYSIKSLLISLSLSLSLSRMQFSTEWDLNGGVMLTDWPEEFEEASEENLKATNLVVNSALFPVKITPASQ